MSHHRNFGFTAPGEENPSTLFAYIVGALAGASALAICVMALHAGGAL